MLKIVKCKNPKGYIDTKIHFLNNKTADKYISNINNEYEINKTKLLKSNLSIKKRKNIIHSRPLKHLLTKVGNKFKLWEELK